MFYWLILNIDPTNVAISPQVQALSTNVCICSHLWCIKLSILVAWILWDQLLRSYLKALTNYIWQQQLVLSESFSYSGSSTDALNIHHRDYFLSRRLFRWDDAHLETLANDLSWYNKWEDMLTGCVIWKQILEECDVHTMKNGIPHDCQINPDQTDSPMLTQL